MREEIRNALRGKTLIDDNRLKVITGCLGLTMTLPGCNAEIGVYKGGSSYLIGAYDPRPLYVCDSFEGLPDLTAKDLRDGVAHHSKGDFNDTSAEAVAEYLSVLPNAKVIKGLFPDPAIHTEMYNQTFSFVHLDVDLYDPTMQCLEFFYPRMVAGGIILTDDYTWKHTPGVELAYNEFFHGRETIIDSGYKSAFIIKKGA